MTIPEPNRIPEGAALLHTVPSMEALNQVSDFLDEQADLLGLSMAVASRLHIVVDEVYSNIVRYSGAGEAVLQIWDGGDHVGLCITDDGQAYDPLTAEEPDISAGVEERSVGGLGLFMVSRMCRSMEYAYLRGKNTLTLILDKTVKKSAEKRTFDR